MPLINSLTFAQPWSGQAAGANDCCRSLLTEILCPVIFLTLNQDFTTAASIGWLNK